MDKLNVAVIGHSGMGGRELTKILLDRGHNVTGISIDSDKVPIQKNLTNIVCNVFDVPALTKALKGHDVVVSAFSGGHEVSLEVYYRQLEGTRAIKKAFKQSKGKYLIYIGGAASLYVAPNIQMNDDSKFPKWYYGSMPPTHLRWLGDITGEEFFNEAAARKESGEIAITDSDLKLEEMVKDWQHVPLLEGCRMALELFEGDYTFEWSFLSPPWFYRPGKGSGTYNLGVDYMIMNNGVPSGISVPDLQLAVADEVENQALIHKHWTCAGEQKE